MLHLHHDLLPIEQRRMVRLAHWCWCKRSLVKLGKHFIDWLPCLLLDRLLDHTKIIGPDIILQFLEFVSKFWLNDICTWRKNLANFNKRRSKFFKRRAHLIRIFLTCKVAQNVIAPQDTDNRPKTGMAVLIHLPLGPFLIVVGHQRTLLTNFLITAIIHLYLRIRTS